MITNQSFMLGKNEKLFCKYNDVKIKFYLKEKKYEKCNLIFGVI